MLRILVTVRPFSSIDLLSKICAIRYLANEERAISTKLSIFQQEFCFSPTLMLWIQFRSAAVVTFSMLKFIFRKNGTIQTPNLAYVFLMWSIESQQIINILILYFQYFANQRKKKTKPSNKQQAPTFPSTIQTMDAMHHSSFEIIVKDGRMGNFFRFHFHFQSQHKGRLGAQR